MIELKLTEEQRQELTRPDPVAIDPVTREEYVLVRREAYERLKSAQDDLDPREAYAAMDRAFAPIWGEPKMADYDDEEER